MSFPLFTYTFPGAERALVEGYRRMGPGANLTWVREVTQGVRQMAQSPTPTVNQSGR